jgi:hypothetical protein
VDVLTKRQKNHAVDGIGNFRFGIADKKPNSIAVSSMPVSPPAIIARARCAWFMLPDIVYRSFQSLDVTAQVLYFTPDRRTKVLPQFMKVR